MPNQEAVKLGIRAGLALGCNIARRSKFDRKQYFYAGAWDAVVGYGNHRDALILNQLWISFGLCTNCILTLLTHA